MITKNMILTLIVIFVTFLILRSIKFLIKKKAEQKKSVKKRIYYVTTFAYVIVYLKAFLILAIIWNVELGGVTVFASSLFAITGVALFAQWSILSNVTSSIIIFFTFPARVGDKIQIMDNDNRIVGEIIAISLFHIEMIDEDNHKILYPNNLFIQKPVKYLKDADKKIKKYI